MGRVLPEPQVAALAALAKSPLVERFYLAGGTALALQLAHRESYDLDFFREEPFDPTAELAGVVGEGWTVTRTEPSTAHLLFQGVRVSLLGYPYPLLRPLVVAPPPWESCVRLASIEDVLAMKLSAVGSRGARRDFVDLFFGMRHLGLGLVDVLALFDQKFRGARYDRYHFARAVTYFADAEKEPIPKMLAPLDWPELKRFFELEAKKLLLSP
ncbi:MAG: nucleotidyl transferase AbiEii/AbiGii toxin family protein [Myxococcota bacterium]